jgi:hypothetical protein
LKGPLVRFLSPEPLPSFDPLHFGTLLEIVEPNSRRFVVPTPRGVLWLSGSAAAFTEVEVAAVRDVRQDAALLTVDASGRSWVGSLEAARQGETSVLEGLGRVRAVFGTGAAWRRDKLPVVATTPEPSTGRWTIHASKLLEVSVPPDARVVAAHSGGAPHLLTLGADRSTIAYELRSARLVAGQGLAPVSHIVAHQTRSPVRQLVADCTERRLVWLEDDGCIGILVVGDVGVVVRGVLSEGEYSFSVVDGAAPGAP